MSKSDLIRELLADAKGPMSTDDINAAIGCDESEVRSTGALLYHLQVRGQVQNTGQGKGAPGMWVKGSDAPPPQARCARGEEAGTRRRSPARAAGDCHHAGWLHGAGRRWIRSDSRGRSGRCAPVAAAGAQHRRAGCAPNGTLT